MAGWELIPHPTGPWLLRVGARLYEVPADRVPDLRADGPPPALLDRPARRSRRAALWLRVQLFPSRQVRRMAGRLHPLTRGPVLAALAGLGFAGYALAWETGGFGRPGLSLPGGAAALGLLAATALWHELGHAAALRRGGYPPGGIGGGLLFVIPVLYADVSAVSALPRRDRLRVDLAGVCFQAAAGGLLAAAGAVGGWEPFVWAALLALAAVTWSLFPFLRTDGYWVLCDLLGMRDLDRASGAFARVYRVLDLAFMAGVGWVLLRRVSAWSSLYLTGAPELREGLLGTCWLLLAWRLVAALRAPGAQAPPR